MSKKSKIINGLLVILSVIILLAYINLVDGPEKVIHVFQNSNVFWLLTGFLFMIVYWYLEGHVLNDAVSLYGPKLKAKQAAKNCMIGQFFNNITPSSTGGQPMQAYYMHKCGISYGFATSALLIRFIIYQISLTIISIVVLIFKYNDFAAKVQGFSALMIIGFTINTCIAVMLLLIGFKKSVASNIMKFIVVVLNKLHIVKKLDRSLKRVDEEVEMFNKGFEQIKSHPKKILCMHLLTILQLIVFFSINITIAGAFGIKLSPTTAFDIITGAACVQMSSSFVPLPGAAGGAELSYYVLYGSIFPSAKISAAVLMWRILTFYFPLIVGLFFSKDIFGNNKIEQDSLDIKT